MENKDLNTTILNRIRQLKLSPSVKVAIAFVLTPYLCFFQALFSYPVFFAYGLSGSEARIATAVLGVILAFYTMSFPAFLSSQNSIKQKFAFMTSIILILAFHVMGVQRAEFLSLVSRYAGEETTYTPITYTALMTLASVIGIIINYPLRNKEEKQNNN